MPPDPADRDEAASVRRWSRVSMARGPSGQRTVTIAVIDGWILQW